MRLGYVYLIGPVDGPIKIGHATNIKSRLCQLQIGNWQKLDVLHAVSMPWLIVKSLEKALHEQFQERQLRGEWFDVPLEVLKPSLDSMAAAWVKGRKESDHFNKHNCYYLCADPPDSYQAVTAYRNIANDPKKAGQAESINRIMMKTVGQAAYVMFLTAIVQNKDIASTVRNNSGLARQAEASLITALDVLPKIMRKMADQDYERRHVDYSRKSAA